MLWNDNQVRQFEEIEKNIGKEYREMFEQVVFDITNERLEELLEETGYYTDENWEGYYDADFSSIAEFYADIDVGSLRRNFSYGGYDNIYITETGQGLAIML